MKLPGRPTLPPEETLGWVDGRAVQSIESYWDDGYDEGRAILKANGYDIGQKMLGQGRYAKVFPIENEPNYVAKFTGDPTDAMSWVRVGKYGRQIDGLAETPCVFAAPTTYPAAGWLKAEEQVPRRMFVIVQERLQPLSSTQQSFFAGKEGKISTYLPMVILPFLATGRRLPVLDETWARYHTSRPTKNELWSYIMDEAAYTNVPHREVHRMIHALTELSKLGVYPADIHGGNVMQSNGEFRLTDLGHSETPDTSVPIA